MRYFGAITPNTFTRGMLVMDGQNLLKLSEPDKDGFTAQRVLVRGKPPDREIVLRYTWGTYFHEPTAGTVRRYCAAYGVKP